MRSLAVAGGGAVGVVARWSVGELIPTSPGDFPMATLVVNVTGAFALGVIGVLLIERLAGTGELRTFLTIGVMGSYTTFSTMAVEGVRLIDSGDILLAGAYWVASLVLGLSAGLIGMWLANVPKSRVRET